MAGTRQDKYSSTHRNESTTYFTIGRKFQLYILYPKIMEMSRQTGKSDQSKDSVGKVSG